MLLADGTKLPNSRVIQEKKNQQIQWDLGGGRGGGGADQARKRRRREGGEEEEEEEMRRGRRGKGLGGDKGKRVKQR